MNSPALAMAWQIWTRDRLGLKISAACLLLMVITFPPILRDFDNNVAFVLTMIPAAFILAHVANLLLFTDEVGNITSGYPRRMFALPVTNRTLVLWPLLFSVIAVVALWLVISVLIYERGGYRPPLLVPAIALAVIMAWIQAVCWLPIKSKLLQVYALSIGLMLLLGAPSWLLIRRPGLLDRTHGHRAHRVPGDLRSGVARASRMPAAVMTGHSACKASRTGSWRPWIASRSSRSISARRPRRSSGTRTAAIPGFSRG